MVASAGSLALVGLAQNVPSLRQVVWVTDPSNKHMDWQGSPEHETKGKLQVTIWDQLVERSPTMGSELPANDQGLVPGNLIVLWQKGPGGLAKTVEFTQKVRHQLKTLPDSLAHSL